MSETEPTGIVSLIKDGNMKITHHKAKKGNPELVLPRQAFFFSSTAEGIHVGSLDVCGGLNIVGIRNQVRQT